MHSLVVSQVEAMAASLHSIKKALKTNQASFDTVTIKQKGADGIENEPILHQAKGNDQLGAQVSSVASQCANGVCLCVSNIFLFV